MKEVWLFAKWHWNKWSWSQRVYLLGTAFFGSGIVDYWQTGQTNWRLQTALGIWACVLAKWFFWDSTIESWKNYKREKSELFNTIDKGHL